MEQHFPRLLDVKTAARYLSISRAKLYQWIDTGKIKSYKIDSRRLLDIRDLDEFVENLKKVGWKLIKLIFKILFCYIKTRFDFSDEKGEDK